MVRQKPAAIQPRLAEAAKAKFGAGEIVRFIEGGKVEVRFGAETKTLIASVPELFTPDAS